MHPEKATPSFRRWHKILSGIFLLLVLLWGAALAFVPGLIRQSAQNWAQGIGRKLEIDGVRLHPLSLAIELNGIRLSDRDGSPLLRLQRLYVEPTPRALLIGRWRVSELQLDQPQLNLSRDAAGIWNWARFAREVAGKPSAGSKAGSTPRIQIDAFRLTAGRLHLLDAVANPGQTISIQPLNLSLTDISTLPEPGGIRLQAGLEGGGQLEWKGNLQLQPLQSAGQMTLRDLPLAGIWPYVHPYVKLPAPAGAVSLSSHYRFDLRGKAAQLVLDPFSLELKGLRLSDPQHRQTAALRQLRVEAGRFDLQKQAVSIGKIALEGGTIEALRQPDGVINWASALPASSAQPAAAPAPWSLKVGEIALDGWHARLTDQSFRTPLLLDFSLPHASTALQVSSAQGLILDNARVDLADLQAGASGQRASLTLQHASLASSALDLQQRQLKPGAIRLDGLKAQITRKQDGSIDLQQLLQTRQSERARRPPKATPDNPAWKIGYPALALNQGQLGFRDLASATPVSLTLDDLALAINPAQQGDFGFRAGARLLSGKINAEGRLNPQSLALQGHLTADRLSLLPLATYALGHTRLQLRQGQLSAALDLAWNPGGHWKAGGRAELNALSLLEAGQAQPLLAWNSLSLARIRASGMPLTLAVGDMRLNRPVARLVLDAQRQLNLVHLFSAPGAANPPAAKNTGTASSGLPLIDIRRIHLQGANVAFADLGMKPGFSTSMHNLRGSIDGISSRPGRRGSITLDGDVDAHGDVKVRGALSPFAATDNSDIALRFRDIPLSSLNTYAMNLAGWKITDGSLGVELNYHLQQRALSGNNRVVINSIQLGEEVAAPGVSHLPLRLAVALLEDSDRRIDLQLPVSGNLDDPKFSYGHLVWQALINIVEKAATAPFRALGALLGNDGFDAISFVPGEASVAPPEREKLRQLALVLNKRPRVSLALGGCYDSNRDRSELARARVDLAILTVARRAPLEGEPLATPDWQDQRIQAAVKQVFTARIGRLRLMQHTLSPSGPTGAALARLLRSEMIAAEPVDQSALQRLAQSRAEGAYRALLAENAALKPRIHLQAPKAGHAGADGVPLQLVLSGN